MATSGIVSWRLFLRIAALTLAAHACTSDPAPGAGPSGSTHRLEAGEVCSVREECRQGLSCDPARRICLCTSDLSCPGRLQCNPFSGLCVDEVPGCRRDADCGPDQWCDAATRVCSLRQPFCGACTRDEDCGVGNRCLAAEDGRRFCGLACAGPGQCPYGTSCEGGQCVPKRGCAGLVRCTPDSFHPCSGSADCAGGRDQLCEPSLGECVARQSGCGPGFACSAALECVPGCLSDDACADDERCVNAICRPMSRCAADGTCPAGKVCRRDPRSGVAECVPACQTTAECPIGEICSEAEGKWACRPGCLSDADCPPDARCDEGSGTCDRSPGVCQSADVCGPCEECRGGACRFAFDEEFPNRRYCAPCDDSTGPDADCGLGGFCIDGRCAPPCPEDGCPKGFLCQTLVDSSGFAYGWGCFPLDGRCDTECL